MRIKFLHNFIHSKKVSITIIILNLEIYRIIIYKFDNVFDTSGFNLIFHKKKRAADIFFSSPFKCLKQGHYFRERKCKCKLL